jgi:hypothetical protein
MGRVWLPPVAIAGLNLKSIWGHCFKQADWWVRALMFDCSLIHGIEGLVQGAETQDRVMSLLVLQMV